MFKEFPLKMHADAPLAAEAADEAQVEGKFWDFHDRMFENRRSLKRPDLEQYARESGLDSSRFAASLDGHQRQRHVEQDTAQGNALGVTGTPAFFINGRFMSGARPFESFKTVIDEEMANGAKR